MLKQILFLILLPAFLQAQDPAQENAKAEAATKLANEAAGKATKAKTDAIAAADVAIKAGTDAKAAAGDPSWGGSFSVGLATFGTGKREIVAATIENGVVRVTEERSFRAQPWLQANYAAKEAGGFGFFVGVEVSGENKLIRSVGIGPLWQFIDKSSTKRVINLGIGVQWTSIQVLGDGFSENQPAPAGVTAVRYKTETQPGPVICVSFGF